MKIKNLKLKIILLIALMLLTTFAQNASAQNFSTSVNPSVIKIRASSPSVVKAPINIYNSSDQNITYNIFLRPFKANSDFSGEPNFDPELSEEYKSFFEKVTISDQGKPLSELTVPPFQRKNLLLMIPVTDEVEQRDYYFTAIFLSQTASGEAKTNIVLNKAGLGVNLLLTVGSDDKSTGAISKFTIPRFVSNGPVEAELEISNTSKHFVTSKGNLVIKNMFGQTVGNVEIEPTTILENSSRIIANSNGKLAWNENFLLGIYKADLNVAISENGPLLHESKVFFALPVKGLLVTVSLITILTWLIRAAKLKNRIK